MSEQKTFNVLSIIGGNSGTGKTSSLRHLGKETVVLNVERKMLPFADNGVTNIAIGNTPKLFEALNRLADNEEYRIIVIDSFSEWIDILLLECKQTLKGFDVWNEYNSKIQQLFTRLKTMKNKYVFLIGHTEILQNADGDQIFRIKVKGKENEGMIEKHATCVFFSHTIKKPSGRGVEYKFITNTDGKLPAKTPFGMFKEEEEFLIDNDVKKVVQYMERYYKIENKTFPEVQTEVAANA
jgi:Cdc6-like AAA superfamily ATPase